jgi:hypothetical protein
VAPQRRDVDRPRLLIEGDTVPAQPRRGPMLPQGIIDRRPLAWVLSDPCCTPPDATRSPLYDECKAVVELGSAAWSASHLLPGGRTGGTNGLRRRLRKAAEGVDLGVIMFHHRQAGRCAAQISVQVPL